MAGEDRHLSDPILMRQAKTVNEDQREAFTRQRVVVGDAIMFKARQGRSLLSCKKARRLLVRSL
ncbi:MAG: hypothetical protein ACXVDE_09365, partial [Tumebacillaceae bacterium]